MKKEEQNRWFKNGDTEDFFIEMEISSQHLRDFVYIVSYFDNLVKMAETSANNQLDIVFLEQLQEFLSREISLYEDDEDEFLKWFKTLLERVNKVLANSNSSTPQPSLPQL